MRWKHSYILQSKSYISNVYINVCQKINILFKRKVTFFFFFLFVTNNLLPYFTATALKLLVFWIAYKSAGVHLWLRWQRLMSLVTARAQFYCVWLISDCLSELKTDLQREEGQTHMLCLTCANTHTCSNLTLTHLHTRPMSLRCEVRVCVRVCPVSDTIDGRVCVFGSAVSLPPWFCPRWHVLTIARVSTWFSTASTSLNVCHVGIYHIFTLSLTVSFEACLLPIFKKWF